MVKIEYRQQTTQRKMPTRKAVNPNVPPLMMAFSKRPDDIKMKFINNLDDMHGGYISVSELMALPMRKYRMIYGFRCRLTNQSTKRV